MVTKKRKPKSEPKPRALDSTCDADQQSAGSRIGGVHLECSAEQSNRAGKKLSKKQRENLEAAKD